MVKFCLLYRRAGRYSIHLRILSVVGWPFGGTCGVVWFLLVSLD